MAKTIISRAGELIPEDKRKILIGAGIAGAGAFLTYLLDAVPNVDFGAYAPVVVAILSVLINIVRKYATETRY